MTSDQITNNYSLSQIYYEEENDNAVYAIREEIMERVMSEIDIIYSQQKLIEFVVDSAHSAMVKLIGLYFYHHNDLPNVIRDWPCDEPNPPSKPDTWVSKKVPTKKKDDQPLETLILSQTLDSSCSCGMDTSCYCFDPKMMVPEYLKDKSFESIENPSASAMDSLLQSTRSSVSDTIKYLEDRQQSDTEKNENEQESRTSSTERILNESLYRLNFLKKKVRLSKARLQAPPKLNYNVQSKGVKLPPIRVDSKFDAINTCEQQNVESNKI